jgi:hypothetical protein
VNLNKFERRSGNEQKQKGEQEKQGKARQLKATQGKESSKTSNGKKLVIFSFLLSSKHFNF